MRRIGLAVGAALLAWVAICFVGGFLLALLGLPSMSDMLPFVATAGAAAVGVVAAVRLKS